jgi:hypothetical protein
MFALASLGGPPALPGGLNHVKSTLASGDVSDLCLEHGKAVLDLPTIPILATARGNELIATGDAAARQGRRA